MTISKEKKALLHVGKQQLMLTEPEYRAILYRAARVNSSSDLDEIGFERVVVEFERLGFQPSRGKAPISARTGMATPAQLAKIRTLWRGYKGQDDEPALCRWLETHFHVSHLRFLKAEPAGKAVAILGKMLTRQNTEAIRPGR